MDSPSPLNLRDDHGGYLKKGGSSSGAVFQERLQQGFKWLKIKGNRNETLEEIDQSAEKDPWFPSMTRKQRFLGFLGFFAAGILLSPCPHTQEQEIFDIIHFWISLPHNQVTIAWLVVRCLVNWRLAFDSQLADIFHFFSFGVLRGPYNHFHGMVKADRLPQTTLYFFSMVATLFFALQLQSTLLTVIAAAIQIFTLIWYTFSYTPGGQTGFMLFGKLATSMVKKTATSTFSA